MVIPNIYMVASIDWNVQHETTIETNKKYTTDYYVYGSFRRYMSLSERSPSYISFMRGFLPLLNGLLDAANLLKYVQDVRRYFCA
jgi:hypothetical protein